MILPAAPGCPKSKGLAEIETVGCPFIPIPRSCCRKERAGAEDNIILAEIPLRGHQLNGEGIRSGNGQSKFQRRRNKFGYGQGYWPSILGTTNSVVAVMEGCNPGSNSNPEGGRHLTPSVVAFQQERKRLVGQTAKRQAVINPERTILSIKRPMGTDHTVNIDGKKYTPQEVSAMTFEKN